MLRYGIPRIVLIIFGCAILLIAAMVAFDRPDPDLAILISFAVFTTGVLILDTSRTGRRVLHDFRRGRYDLARRGTVWLLRYTLRRASRATLLLNLAACHLAAGQYEAGGRILDAIDREALADAVAGIWENNYAYFLLGTNGDPNEALRLSDKATAVGPGNPAFRSTRGIAQLALGRADDAIAELQAAVDAGLDAQGPAAMAENYYHLARAWEARGESAYARDHYLKSVNMGPDTLFGRKSAEMLQELHSLWPERR